jgi:hypothetical protein
VASSWVQTRSSQSDRPPSWTAVRIGASPVSITHDDATYQHCLMVAGLAAHFAVHLGFGEDDQRRFLGIEAAGLVEDRQGDARLADVVDEGGAHEAALVVLAEAEMETWSGRRRSRPGSRRS